MSIPTKEEAMQYRLKQWREASSALIWGLHSINIGEPPWSVEELMEMEKEDVDVDMPLIALAENWDKVNEATQHMPMLMEAMGLAEAMTTTGIITGVTIHLDHIESPALTCTIRLQSCKALGMQYEDYQKMARSVLAEYCVRCLRPDFRRWIAGKAMKGVADSLSDAMAQMEGGASPFEVSPTGAGIH